MRTTTDGRGPTGRPQDGGPLAAAGDDAPRRLTLLVNPTAGGGRSARTAATVAARLRDRGATCTVVATRDAAHAAEATADALGRGEVAVAVGGDGMLRIVASVAAGRPDATVGVIPAGRGNDFARFLGLPTTPDAAADALLDGVVCPVDTGVARDGAGVERTFLSLVSVGFDSEANRIANGAPAVLGGLVYVWGVLGALAGLRPIPVDLALDGAHRAERVVLVAVANAGAYGGGMHMAPDASVADGLLDVVLVRHRGRHEDRCTARDRARLVRFLPRVFRGTHLRVPNVQTARCGTVTIAADAPLEAYADGDPVGRLPLAISTRPASLRLLVPTAVAARLVRTAPTATVGS